ncbi:hypothetical protein Nepgr_009764 [Nepenthes gracilis]|uniref:Protein kinase domain-containing protein n=1 Tax=Nepenthes gracilis TaxID=150966 RepID=A0AAD3SBZ4_NEPGR|nr:hypothetical protein Nepgr_009764 [Nepenthes gracilis]
MAGGESKVVIANCKSFSDDAGGLPVDVLISMANENWQTSTAVMERLTAASAVEPYELVSCAFVSYGSCAIDLAEGESPSSNAILFVLVLAAHFLRLWQGSFSMSFQPIMQAWFETDVARFLEGSTWDSRTAMSLSFTRKGRSSSDVENDIIAKSTCVSIAGIGQIGTYFYTAPEIEQGWPDIDEKADLYSLGVVFFELGHPFRTAMERHFVLIIPSGQLPSTRVAEFPEQATLLRSLLSHQGMPILDWRVSKECPRDTCAWFAKRTNAHALIPVSRLTGGRALASK